MTDEAQIRALKWRCRRGMRELDQLLAGYLVQHYASAETRLQDAFVRLLELQDPVIFGYLVRREVAEDEDIREIIERILSDTDTRKIQS
ncbi:MAG: succinate dehydrogenase assembly factor 2 [Pseudomonadota bacterium]